MTLAERTLRREYLGNDSTTVFAFTDRWFGLEVLLSDNVTFLSVVQIEGIDYTIPEAVGTSSASITFTVAPSTGQTVIINSVTPRVQTSDYQPNTVFPAITHENALDKGVAMTQEALGILGLGTDQSRILHLDEGFTGTFATEVLPIPNGILQSNPTNDGFVFVPVIPGEIDKLAIDGSNFMTGPLKVADGTDALPSLASANDLGKGFNFTELDKIGITVDGIKRGFFDSKGLNLHAPSTEQVSSGILRLLETDESFRGGFIQNDGLTNELLIGSHSVFTFDTNDDIIGLSLRRSDAHVSAPQGIVFGAPIGTYPAANTIKHYSFGDWIPGLTFGGFNSGMVLSVQEGSFIRIGKKVTVNGVIEYTTKGSSTGPARIKDLPFSVASNIGSSDEAVGIIGNRVNVTLSNGVVQAEAGQTLLTIDETIGSTTFAANDTNFGSSIQIVFSITYFTDDP